MGWGGGVLRKREHFRAWAAVNPMHMPVLQPPALRSREIIEKKVYF